MPAAVLAAHVRWRLGDERMDRLKQLVFSARTASASNEIGGSIAIMARSWKKWFGTMSRNAPVAS